MSCAIHAFGQLEDFLMSPAGGGPTLYSGHGLHSYDPGYAMRTRWVHPTVETTLRFRGFSAPGIGVGPILADVGGHATYAFGYSLAFDRDHLGK